MENKETKKQTKKNRERKLKGEGTISEMLMCTIMRNWDIRWNPF